MFDDEAEDIGVASGELLLLLVGEPLSVRVCHSRIGIAASLSGIYYRFGKKPMAEALVERKKSIAEDIVGTGEQWITELSNAELHEVFSLRTDAVRD